MAKVVKNVVAVALILAALVAAAASAPLPAEGAYPGAAVATATAAAAAGEEQGCGTMVSSVKKALESVAAAAPDAKKCEMKDVVFKHAMYLAAALGEAAGDAKKVTAITDAYRMAADTIMAAPPGAKSAILEQSFKKAATATPAA